MQFFTLGNLNMRKEINRNKSWKMGKRSPSPHILVRARARVHVECHLFPVTGCSLNNTGIGSRPLSSPYSPPPQPPTPIPTVVGTPVGTYTCTPSNSGSARLCLTLRYPFPFDRGRWLAFVIPLLVTKQRIPTNRRIRTKRDVFAHSFCSAEKSYILTTSLAITPIRRDHERFRTGLRREQQPGVHQAHRGHPRTTPYYNIHSGGRARDRHQHVREFLGTCFQGEDERKDNGGICDCSCNVSRHFSFCLFLVTSLFREIHYTFCVSSHFSFGEWS